MDIKAPSTLIHAWVLAPGVAMLVALGIGRLLERAAGMRLGALILPAGFVGAIPIMVLLLELGAGGVLTAVLAGMMGLTGLIDLGLALRRRERIALGSAAWAAGSALGAYAVMMAPLVGSGRAGVLGYVLNNDPAVHISVVSLLRENGASVVQPTADSYHFVSGQFGGGYPIGSHVWPMLVDVLAELEPFLSWTPMIALIGAMMALVLRALLLRIGAPPTVAAIGGTVIACGYLPFSYAAQGGAKELLVALTIFASIALFDDALRQEGRWRALIPSLFAAAAAVNTFGLAAMPWLGTALVVGLGALVWRARQEKTLKRTLLVIGGLAVAATAVALPSVLSSIEFARANAGAIQNPAQVGNLLGPVPWVEAFNLWLAADYRVNVPDWPTLTKLGLALVATAGAIGLIQAVRRRHAVVLTSLVMAIVGSVFISARYAIYFDAKTYVVLAPAFGLVTAAGVVALLQAGRRWRRLGTALGLILAAGVVASDAFVYTEIWRTPDRLRELSQISERLDGAGPILVNDREDYAKYMLRESEPWESWGAWQPARNLRFEGDPLPIPHAPDFDDYTTEHLNRFPLMLERKGPTGSRPPASHRPWFETESYRVWRRSGRPPTVHDPLGVGRPDGTARFDCRTPAARSLLLRARRTGAAVRASVRSSPLHLVPGSRARTSAGSRRAAILPGDIRLGPESVSTVPLDIPAGRYRLWTQGEFARGFRYRLGAQVLGDVSDDLGPTSGWRYVGRADVLAGEVELTMTGLGRPWWQSGSRREDVAGQLAFEPATQRHRVVSVPGAKARRLCGRQLDWIEI
jgi:hypothetical protein